MPLLFAFALQAAPPDAFASRAWARFSRAPALRHTSEVVDVGTDGTDAGVLHYKLRLTRSRLGKVEAVLWANSRTCPAVRAVLTGMETIALPRSDAPGIGPDTMDIVLDGVGYELRTPSTDSNGELTLRSNVETPLARWVDRSLTALRSCWSAVDLRVG